MSTSVADLLGQPSDRTLEPPVATDDERPVCSEPGCGRPCRKRRGAEGFLPYCSIHNTAHAGGGGSPKSRDPKLLEEARNASAKRIEQQLTGWLALLQRGLVVQEDWYCAKIVGEEGPAIAKAAADVAQDFDWVKTALEKTDKYGTLAILLVAVSKVGLAIGVHHGYVPYAGPIKFLVPPMAPPVPTPEPFTVVPPMQQEGATSVV